MYLEKRFKKERFFLFYFFWQYPIKKVKNRKMKLFMYHSPLTACDRRIYSLVEHLRCSFFAKIVNVSDYFHKQSQS